MPTRPLFILFHLLLWGYAAAQPDAMPPEMVFVQGGTFTMGCQSGQINCENDESPEHEVTISDFFIGRYEVTQSQWLAIVPEFNPFEENLGQGDTYPAYRISWYSAISFCNRLSIQLGYTPAYYYDESFSEVFDSIVAEPVDIDVHINSIATGFRLLTEAEWEYAGKGGQFSKGFEYSGSNDIDSVAWWDSNPNIFQPSGTKIANELEIYDMSGSIYEWCVDWHAPDFYINSQICFPAGPDTGTKRIIRGGSSFSPDPNDCLVVNRRELAPWLPLIDLGFRICRPIE